jgi:hypothetical protein
MNEMFQVDFVSPVGFDHLAAEIRFQGQVLVRLRCERADGVVEAEFFAVWAEPLKPVVVPLGELQTLLGELAAELRALAAAERQRSR